MMKLSFVEVAGFRGFREKARFDLPGGFVVITGPNGVGKSTLLDAVDFALTGTISKYTVKGARGGGLDSHIWWVGEGEPEANYVSVGFVDKNGTDFTVTRMRQSGLVQSIDEVLKRLGSKEVGSGISPEVLVQTTLIRDETIASLSLDLPEQARFANVREAIGGLTGKDHSQRTAVLLSSAKAAALVQKQRMDGIQSELGRTLGALTEARSEAERSTDVSQALSIIEALEPALIDLQKNREETIRGRVADRRRDIDAFLDGIRRFENLKSEQEYFTSTLGTAALSAARAEVEAAVSLKARAEQEVEQSLLRDAAERNADDFAAHLAALLEHGEALGLQEGHCPLCSAERTGDMFAASIAAAKSNLAERGMRLAATSSQLAAARAAKSESEEKLAAAQQRLDSLQIRQKTLQAGLQDFAALCVRFGISSGAVDLKEARRMLLKRQEEAARLERALRIVEASGAHDRVVAFEKRVADLRIQLETEALKLGAAETAAERARQIDSSTKAVSNEILTEQFDTVMPLLKELYRRLRPHTEWREIESDFGGRVRASLNFTVGDGYNPQFLFSSGQRRAAGIAFLLAIHLSRPWCRWQTLVLDDPVQHIDDYRALNLVEVLSAIRRTGRQIVVAVEDTALADVLCRRLRSTLSEPGKLYELGTSITGSATIVRRQDVSPFPRDVLHTAEAS